MEKTDKNVAQLTDDEILEGFRNANEHIVKEYFYGYCRVAYCIYDRRYDLQYKPGMDFYSLAHEYYLALCRHDFRQSARTARLRCRLRHGWSTGSASWCSTS